MQRLAPYVIPLACCTCPSEQTAGTLDLGHVFLYARGRHVEQRGFELVFSKRMLVIGNLCRL